jgi:hypothetical protein
LRADAHDGLGRHADALGQRIGQTLLAEHVAAERAAARLGDTVGVQQACFAGRQRRLERPHLHARHDTDQRSSGMSRFDLPVVAHPYRQPVELTDSWLFSIETKKCLIQVSPIAVSTRGGCAGLSDRVAGVTDEAHRY